MQNLDYYAVLQTDETERHRPDAATIKFSLIQTFIAAGLSWQLSTFNMFNRFRQLLRNDDDPIVERICSGTSLCRSVVRDIISRFDSSKYVKIAELLELQTDETFYRDPTEFMPDFHENLALAENDANAELQDRVRGMGFCHLFWLTKKRILHENYKIDWLSPSDMNPMVKFD